MAAGSFLAGVLPDALGLQQALALMPLFSLLAIGALLCAARTYEAGMQRACELAAEDESMLVTPAGAPV